MLTKTTCAALAALSLAPAAWSQTAAPPQALQAERMGPWGFDPTGRDPAVRPGDDFYKSVNGAWDARTAIPADRARYGVFDALRELSDRRSQAVIEAAAADPHAQGEKARIGAFYRAFMNESRAEALDARPLQPMLQAIGRARTRRDLARLMGQANTGFYGAVFKASIYDDARDTRHYAVLLNQGGLGLPDRDYYLTAQFADKKARYQAYVAETLRSIGWPRADEAAAGVVAFESRIAAVSWSRAAQRDDVNMYNPVPVDRLGAFAPGFPWKTYLRAAGLGSARRVVVGEKSAFPKIAAIYGRTPIEVLQAWQAFTTADAAAPYLSKRFAQARFDFRSKALQGQPEERPRWKRGVALLDDQIGEPVGRLYVQAYFPEASKAKMLALVGDLKSAMGARIEHVVWMSPQTKARALAKLAKFNVKIAYPDKWRSYAGLTLDDSDLIGDIERAKAFDWTFRLGRLNGPVDRSEWEMTPQTVNAYYSQTKNEIVFPAAILQPPFFDPQGDDAVNYGAIGGVIGHEITHGFDDQGRQSDGDGMLNDWWTKEDAARFVAQTRKLGLQYSAFEPLPGGKVNGELTMGENIADLGGLLLALDAYHASLKGRPAPVIDGLTGDQRVFLGWAQQWRTRQRDDALRQQLASDPHSPALYRVNGVVRNIDAWYQAFGVKPGDALYVAPEDRVRIW
jgi:putative endopeptidase